MLTVELSSYSSEIPTDACNITIIGNFQKEKVLSEILIGCSIIT